MWKMNKCTTTMSLVCVILQVTTPVDCEVCEVKNGYVYSCDSDYYCCGDICCSIRWTVIGSLFGAVVFFALCCGIIAVIHKQCTKHCNRVTPGQLEQDPGRGVVERY